MGPFGSVTMATFTTFFDQSLAALSFAAISVG